MEGLGAEEREWVEGVLVLELVEEWVLARWLATELVELGRMSSFVCSSLSLPSSSAWLCTPQTHSRVCVSVCV